MSSKALFSKKLPVLKIQDEEKKTLELNFTIEMAHTLKKEMILRLTDERDHFFLYQLRMNEQDFQVLKSQQGLLIDFGSFPDRVIDLLHKCIDKSSNDCHKHSLVFTLMGGCGLSRIGQLAVMESNNFKQLNHLTLEFHPGTDNDVKNYFLENLNIAKDTLEKTQRRLELLESDLNSKLRSCEESLQRKTTELSDLKYEMDKKISEIKLSHEKDLEDARIRFNASSNEIDQAHKRAMQQLESKISNLENSLRLASNEKSRCESQINTLNDSLSRTEEKLNDLRKENSTLKKNLSSIGSDLDSSKKENTRIQTDLAVAEQKIKEKDEKFRSLSAKYEDSFDLNRKLEKDLELKAKELDKLKEVEEKLLVDKTQANRLIVIHQEKIEKYQTDNKALNEKVKKYKKVVNLQETCINENQKKVPEMKKNLEEVKIELRKKEGELERLLQENKTLLSELELCKAKLEDNEKTLAFITKKNTEKEISAFRTPEAAYVTKPQSLTNCSNNASHYRDFRNFNAPNNNQPISCENIISTKVLRMPLDNPPIQEFRQPSVTNQHTSRIPSNPGVGVRPVSSRGLAAPVSQAPQNNGTSNKVASTPIFSNYFTSRQA